MARQPGVLVVTNINTGTAQKTIARLGSVDTPIVVRNPEISFRGVDPVGAKILVEIVKGSSGGTATPSAIANMGNTSVAIAAVGGERDFSAEPTTPGTVIAAVSVHPQHGYTYPGEIELAPLEFLSIRVTSSVAIGCDAHIRFEK